MAKTSWYAKQAAAAAVRTADMVERFTQMTERELVAVLDEIERDDRAMRLDRTANQSGWERMAKRSELVRAELAARRQAVGIADLDEADPLTDAQLDEMDRFYSALNAAAAEEVQDRREEMARLDVQDTLMVADPNVEPF